MFKIIKPHKERESSSELASSSLYNQDKFYNALLKDTGNCYSELIIESPFMTTKRVRQLIPMFENLIDRSVNIIINTKCPDEHESVYMRNEAVATVELLQTVGMRVLYTVDHHRKLVIVDR